MGALVTALLSHLPNLARLKLFVSNPARRHPFVCVRAYRTCDDCRLGRACANADRVAAGVLRGLPAAAAEAGRRLELRVLSKVGRTPEWKGKCMGDRASLVYAKRAGR